MERHAIRGIADCHIADIKERCGLPVKRAWNRPGERQVRCPESKRAAIIAALRHFGLIS